MLVKIQCIEIEILWLKLKNVVKFYLDLGTYTMLCSRCMSQSKNADGCSSRDELATGYVERFQSIVATSEDNNCLSHELMTKNVEKTSQTTKKTLADGLLMIWNYCDIRTTYSEKTVCF